MKRFIAATLFALSASACAGSEDVESLDFRSCVPAQDHVGGLYNGTYTVEAEATSPLSQPFVDHTVTYIPNDASLPGYGYTWTAEIETNGCLVVGGGGTFETSGSYTLMDFDVVSLPPPNSSARPPTLKIETWITSIQSS